MQSKLHRILRQTYSHQNAGPQELNIYFGHEIPAREQIMFGTQLCIHLSNKQTVVKPMLTEGLSYEL